MHCCKRQLASLWLAAESLTGLLASISVALAASPEVKRYHRPLTAEGQ